MRIFWRMVLATFLAIIFRASLIRRELFVVDMIMPVSQAIARQDPMHLSAKKIEDAIA